MLWESFKLKRQNLKLVDTLAFLKSKFSAVKYSSAKLNGILQITQTNSLALCKITNNSDVVQDMPEENAVKFTDLLKLKTQPVKTQYVCFEVGILYLHLTK